MHPATRQERRSRPLSPIACSKLIWRESLWLVKDGIATTQDIDDAVRYGFGLRYAQMGVFDTYRVAGGEAGMRHFMAQFGPCLKWPWTKLMDVPEFTNDLVDLIAGQSDEQSGHMSIREMERIRDDNLIAILHGTQGQQLGRGQDAGALRTAVACKPPTMTNTARRRGFKDGVIPDVSGLTE